MRKLFFILSLAIIVSSCNRHICPAINTNDSSFVKQTDSIIVHDTVISFPALQINSRWNIDSLLNVINRLRQDSTSKEYWVPYWNATDSTLTGAIEISNKGNLQFTCKEDSLKAVIRNLTTAYLQLYVIKQQVKTVQVPVTVMKYKERAWLWWWFSITVLYLGLKITAMFVPSNSAGFLNTILKLFKK